MVGGGKGVEVREVDRGESVVLGVRLSLSCAMLRGFCGASNESYSLGA